MQLSWVSADEWHDVLGEAGFEVERLYGWFDHRPWRPGNEDMVFVARRID